MSNPNPRFTRQEYAERLAKTRRAMEGKDIDLLIVSDPSNMNWLTGYDGWSFYVHQAVIVPPDGDPLWYGRGQDANGARRVSPSCAGVCLPRLLRPSRSFHCQMLLRKCRHWNRLLAHNGSVAATIGRHFA